MMLEVSLHVVVTQWIQDELGRALTRSASDWWDAIDAEQCSLPTNYLLKLTQWTCFKTLYYIAMLCVCSGLIVCQSSLFFLPLSLISLYFYVLARRSAIFASYVYSWIWSRTLFKFALIFIRAWSWAKYIVLELPHAVTDILLAFLYMLPLLPTHHIPIYLVCQTEEVMVYVLDYKACEMIYFSVRWSVNVSWWCLVRYL